MKLNIFIGENHKEEINIYSHKRTKLIDEIETLCQEDALELTGYKNREVKKLDISEICCFITEDNKIFALTKNDKFQLKCRLYNLEEMLGNNFVKINQSCIANIRMIEGFEATFSGSLSVIFKNGYTDYVSRRNLKNVKERLGL